MCMFGVSKYRNVASRPLIRSMATPRSVKRPRLSLALGSGTLGPVPYEVPPRLHRRSPAGRSTRAARCGSDLSARPGVLRVVAGDRARPAPARPARHRGRVLRRSNGALQAWQGWVALGLSAAIGRTCCGASSVSRSCPHDVLDEALTETIGPAAAHTPVAVEGVRLPVQALEPQDQARPQHPLRSARDASVPARRLVPERRDEPSARACSTSRAARGRVGISNKNQQGKPLLIEMASRGWVCFAMNYPLQSAVRRSPRTSSR